MNCQRCGGTLVAGSRFCEECGAPADAGLVTSGDRGRADSTAPARAQTPAATAAPAGPVTADVTVPAAEPAVLPGSTIRLGDGEVVWRQYRAVRLRSRKRGVGTLYVTDARVVFYAWAKGRGAQRLSALVQQVKLEDVSGYSAFVSRRLSTFLLLLTTFFALATIGALVGRSLPLTVIFAIFTVLGLITLTSDWAQRGQAGVTIYSREAERSPVSFGGVGARHPVLDALLTLLLLPLHMLMRSYTVADVLRGKPGDDSDLVVSELGALIMDLQTRGSFAAGHYGVQQGEEPMQARG